MGVSHCDMGVIVICHSNIRANITRDICVIRDTNRKNQRYITRDKCKICDIKAQNSINITQKISKFLGKWLQISGKWKKFQISTNQFHFFFECLF